MPYMVESFVGIFASKGIEGGTLKTDRKTYNAFRADAVSNGGSRESNGLSG